MTTIEEIKSILGYEVETDKTTDGKFIVLYMNFNKAPPPKGDTEEEALSNFLTWLKENTNGRVDPAGDTSIASDNQTN
jgi:hypothetical protein